MALFRSGAEHARVRKPIDLHSILPGGTRGDRSFPFEPGDFGLLKDTHTHLHTTILHKRSEEKENKLMISREGRRK